MLEACEGKFGLTMGLSVSDAIRLLMIHITHEGRLPFAAMKPNATI